MADGKISGPQDVSGTVGRSGNVRVSVGAAYANGQLDGSTDLVNGTALQVAFRVAADGWHQGSEEIKPVIDYRREMMVRGSAVAIGSSMSRYGRIHGKASERQDRQQTRTQLHGSSLRTRKPTVTRFIHPLRSRA